MTRWRTATSTAACLLVAAAAGCGGEDAPRTGSTTTSTTATATSTPTPEPTPSPEPVTLAALRQDGVSLGAEDAPAVLTQFLDLQAPEANAPGRRALPRVVRDYVATGKVRLRLQLLGVLGPGSRRAALVAQGAAEQDRLFQFVEAYLERRGKGTDAERVTDAELRTVCAAAGVDDRRAFRFAASEQAEEQLGEAELAGAQSGVDDTPYFTLGTADDAEAAKPVNPPDLAPEAFTSAIEALLADDSPALR